MKFLGYNITKQQPEKRSEEIYNPNLSTSLQYGLSGSKNTALSLSTVYSAVNLISDAIATLPITIKARNNEGISELDTHPLKDIFTSNLTTKYTLFKTILQSVLLKGNAYCYIERKGGKVVGLRYLQPEDVQIYYRKETKELYYTCSYIGGTAFGNVQLTPKRLTAFVDISKMLLAQDNNTVKKGGIRRCQRK